MARRDADAAGLPLALDFRHVGGAGEFLGRALGLGGGNATIAAKLADASFVDARLAALSGGALAALEIVVEAGGAATESGIAAELEHRLGLQPADAGRCLMLAESSGLALRVESSGPYSSKRIKSLSLLSDCAPLIATRVRGVTLPRVVAPEGLAPPASHALRDLAARIGATLHAAIRETSTGYANRTSLKKLASRVGLEPEGLGRTLDDAVRSGVLGVREGLIVPLLDELRALARGELVLDPSERAVRALIDSDRWYSVAWLDRVHQGVLSPGLPRSRLVEKIDAMPSLVTVEHAGVKFVRRAPASTAGGDGHVTPSFEVMLGPACEPELAAILALAAEPVRFDRVLTLKLGPTSVAAACALGVGVEEILSMLARVGRHEVPDNVKVMVLDWAKSVRRASVRKAWIIEASSPEAAEASARALGSKVLARPTATMLVVDEELAAPGTALAKAGIATGDRPERRRDRFSDPARIGTGPRPALPSWTPTPALVARIEADREAGTLAPVVAIEPDAPSPSQSLRSLAAKQPRGSTKRDFLERIAKLWAAAEVDYAEWASSLDEDDGDAAKLIAVEAPLRLLPFVTRTPKERSSLLAMAGDVLELLADSERRAPTGLTLDGAHVVSMMTKHRDVEELAFGEMERGLARLGVEREPRQAVGRVAATAPPVASGMPRRPVDVDETTPTEVRRQLDALALTQGSAWLRVRSKSQGERLVRLRVERILVRGADATVLGLDLDEELGRSFPVTNVVGIQPC